MVTKISKYILLSEATCKCGHCLQYWLFPPIIFLFDEAREKFGKPVKINSGFRCFTYQLALKKAGLKAADISPHCEGAALDLAISPGTSVFELIKLFRETASKIGFPKPRFGHLAYNDAFLHVDLVFMKFEPFTKIPNPKPALWFEGAEW